MEFHYWHQCIACEKKFDPDRFLYVCPECGNLLMVVRDEDFVKSRVGDGAHAQAYFNDLRFGASRRMYPNNSGVWLWRDFILPGFPKEYILSLNEGQTDLFEVPAWLKKELGMNNLYIKMEGQAPSESFKDRGMPVAISDALRLQKEYPQLGIKGISCASTGDTSASAAVYAAYVRDRLSCVVLLPYEKVSDSQLFQAMTHGATVKAIRHPQGFDGCMKLIQEFTKAHPEYVLVNSKNDMRVVGQETIALEILQDFSWKVPDWIAIPIGNSGNLAALLNSLLRAKELGLIDKLPGIIGSQSASANTLARWAKSEFTEYAPGTFKDTVASAMNINDPVSFPRVKKLYEKFNIKFYSVEEEAILKTWARFMRAGANVCPQSAVALNCVMQARAENTIKEDDVVVSISTASGIKFTDSGIKFHKNGAKEDYANSYDVVDGNLEALEQSLGNSTKEK
ncbi:MAG: threonine synthase [Patescibacteria group bacterium]|nr:threonine synthase [Patescibacteria group bacterium]